MVFAVPTAPYGAAITYRLATRGDAQARIVIQDAAGDTLRVLNGSSFPGLHTVRWDFRGKAPAPAALSPSQRRDSVVSANRRAFVFDSLGTSGMDTLALGRFRRMLEGGDMAQMMQAFGGGGGGAGAPTPSTSTDRFNQRPGEQAGGPGGGGGRAAGLAAAANIDQSKAFEIMQLISPPGASIFRTLGGRPQAPIVDTGDYLVTLSVAGKTLKQRVRVVRASGTGSTGLPFESNEARR
jgi:hypothetical protein